MTDQWLWMNVASDGSVLADMLVRHGDAVFAHCLRRGASWIDAQDHTALVFFEAWRQAGKVRFVNGSMRPWLLLTATNVGRNAARSRRRYEQALGRLPAPEPEPDHAETVLDAISSGEVSARVTAAIGRLSPRHQEVVGLCDLAGLSYTDAAAALGIPVGTVRSRLSRAHSQLKKILGACPPVLAPYPPAKQEEARS